MYQSVGIASLIAEVADMSRAISDFAAVEIIYIFDQTGSSKW